VGPMDYSQNGRILFGSIEIEFKKEAEYWKCRRCNSFFVQNIASEEKTVWLYSNSPENKWSVNQVEEEKTVDLISLIESFPVKGLSVLDVGCSSGELLDFLAKRGARTSGIEYSPISSKEAVKKGHKIYNKISEIPKGVHYDIIFAFDLVEHLYNINDFLNICEQHLIKGGKLVILTGNPRCLSARLARNNWWYPAFPEHIIFPSKIFFNGLKKLILISYIPVFHSQNHYKKFIFNLSHPFLRLIKVIIMIVIGRYNGYPSLDKDHVFIIMKKI
jgi:2-polyprenyl-3-methyl-5-hydroxy-6-metoxy-1,4-benzoquinol methylase